MPADPPPSTPPAGSRPALDLDALDALRAARGDAVVRDLIRIFTADARARCDRIRDALARGDLPAVAGEAHTLRSAAATLGAAALAQRAGALEQAATDGAHADAAAHFTALEVELARAHAALAPHAR